MHSSLHIYRNIYGIETPLVERNDFHVPSLVFIHTGVMLILKSVVYKHWNSTSMRSSHILLIFKTKSNRTVFIDNPMWSWTCQVYHDSVCPTITTVTGVISMPAKITLQSQNFRTPHWITNRKLLFFFLCCSLENIMIFRAFMLRIVWCGWRNEICGRNSMGRHAFGRHCTYACQDSAKAHLALLQEEEMWFP